MKKVLATYVILATLVWLVGPALVMANGSISTGLDRGTGGGTSPIVKAKWEMKGPSFTGTTYTGYTGTGGEGMDDDKSTAGAQFAAPGTWDANMNYTVCAIVTDPDGVSDIKGVYADIYYPSDRSFHANSTYPDPQPDPKKFKPGSGDGDKGLAECGAFIEQNTLLPLTKTAGYHLFCEAIRENNDSLPYFYDGYDYYEICGADGELMKETAKVYCDDKSLIWEDPAGSYKVKIMAQDKSGNSSPIAENHFTYLEHTGFERDFGNVSYGTVMLDTHKRIAGDLTFESEGQSTKPTIRNIGNTRLSVWIAQDDMDLGQSSGLWNVRYDARVGNYEGDWKEFDPFGYKGGSDPTLYTNYTQLEDVLDLSEIEEMDFSILVKKWPDGNGNYSGSMWLSAKKAPFRLCPSPSS